MCNKATIVTYAFSVQHFENTTIVAYVSLRVNWFSAMKINGMYIYAHLHFPLSVVPTSQSEVTMQLNDNQRRQDDERSQVEHGNGL